MKHLETPTGRLQRKLFRRNRGSMLLRSRFVLANFTGGILDSDNKQQLKGGRYALLGYIPKAGRGVEVGVWRGDFSSALLTHLKPALLTLVDPWQISEDDKVVFPRSKESGQAIGVEQSAIENQGDAGELYQYVCARFSPHSNVKIMRSTSVEAAGSVTDQSLDWAYIDGSHYYEDVRADLESWLPKLKSNGILFGDDYYWRDPEGNYSVKKAVDEFISTHRPQTWVVFRGQFLLRF